MTKEQVQSLWDSKAQQVIKAQNITGGSVDKGWNQSICGAITYLTILDLQTRKLDPQVQHAACIACCTIGANCSQQGQRLFSVKAQKATTLASDLVKLVK